MSNSTTTSQSHDHDHEHSHGKSPVILYFVGLVAYILAFFFEQGSTIQIGLFLFATISSGYHITLEGIEDTYYTTKQKRRFTPNVHILMTVAAIGAISIGSFEEAGLLILIFAGAHFLEDYAKERSKREITNLINLNPTEARLILADGSTKTVSVTDLKIGDQLQVLNGDQVPTDGTIISGVGVIDESSINGESIPKEKTKGTEVYGSTLNVNGSFTMEVTKDTNDTLFAKIIDLVNQSQSNMSQTATRIQKIEPYYVTTVLILVPLLILLSPVLFGWSWEQSFYRGMVFLVSASPCALAVSAVPATLSGISNLAKRGVLFKGGSFLTNLADIRAVAFDKTGTLTEGKPSVTDYHFEASSPQEEQAIIDIIVAMEKTANHPLALAIIDFFEAKTPLTLEAENIIGKGVVTEYENHQYLIGKPESFKNVDKKFKNMNTQFSKEGKTVVFLAKDDKIIGLIAMMDQPNRESRETIQYLKEQGIHTAMITGDSAVTGNAIGSLLAIDQVIGNVLPEDKAAIVKEQQSKHGMTAMLGDGINDAPALVAADIGVAMGEGTDIAMDVADVILMRNNLSQFIYAHKTSKRLNRNIWQNIFISMAVVVSLVILNFFGEIDITVGIIAHEGSTLLVLFNSLRLLLPSK